MADIDWGSMRVLVVDDNANFRRITRTILQAVKVKEIDEVESADAALEHLGETTPDMILTDWRMEGMDGLDLVRTLRARGYATPVVMMTGYNESDFENQAREAGVSAFMEKPVTPKGLAQAMAKALKAAEAA